MPLRERARRPGELGVLTRASLLAHLAAWRLAWNRADLDYRHAVPGNDRFMSARDAAALVPDGAVVMASGLGGNARPSIVYRAIRERFSRCGHPRGLTCLALGGLGARGKAPGTLEELAVEGLCTRLVAGHLETFRAMLELGDAGVLELECLPQGVMARLLAAQARGEPSSLVTEAGVGTFLDPRVGPGSRVAGPGAPQYVGVDGARLRYTMPAVNVAVFNTPAADRHGNLYATNAALVAEGREAARAARRHHGLVIANVGLLVDEARDAVFLPAEEVDAIVLEPGTEQTVSVPHRRHWPMFTPACDVPVEEALARLRFLNRVMGVTPRRGPVDEVLARVAAWIVAREAGPGALVNVGVGLPEEVARALHQAGATRHLTLFTEAGVLGGVPAPGVFFGAAVSPARIVSSAEVFELCRERLDATVLGLLEADSEGNVNSSRRGAGALGCVGPGGSVDLAAAARTIVFVGSWMLGGLVRLAGGRVELARRGQPKFVDAVREITFSGPEALRAGKEVFYCTHVGVFRLTRRGMQLSFVMPGVDVRRDVLETSPMAVVLPPGGELPVIGASIVTGEGFALPPRWPVGGLR